MTCSLFEEIDGPAGSARSPGALLLFPRRQLLLGAEGQATERRSPMQSPPRPLDTAWRRATASKRRDVPAAVLPFSTWRSDDEMAENARVRQLAALFTAVCAAPAS